MTALEKSPEWCTYIQSLGQISNVAMSEYPPGMEDTILFSGQKQDARRMLGTTVLFHSLNHVYMISV